MEMITDYTIFGEMTTREIKTFLEKGEVPVRLNKVPTVKGHDDLSADKWSEPKKGEVPIRDNSVENKAGHDDLDADEWDFDKFMDELDADDIKPVKHEAKKIKAKKEEDKDEDYDKEPIEPNEIEPESEALDEDFDLDSEYNSLLNEEDEELKMFDEELADMESFLENYELFMED